MLDMIKLFLGGKVGLVKSLDLLEKPFSDLIRKAQQTSSSLTPETFAKELVDEVQRQCCKLLNIDPKKVDPDF